MPKSGAPGSAMRTFRGVVAYQADSFVCTHPLEDNAAMLVSAYLNWNAGQPHIISQDEDSITIGFPVPCPYTPSGGEIVYTVTL